MEDINVIECFHVVAGEANGDFKHSFITFLLDFLKRGFNFRLEPRFCCACALALPRHPPELNMQPFNDAFGGFFYLPLIRISSGDIPCRNTMARKYHYCGITLFLAKPLQTLDHAFFPCVDEHFVVVPARDECFTDRAVSERLEGGSVTPRCDLGLERRQREANHMGCTIAYRLFI